MTKQQTGFHRLSAFSPRVIVLRRRKKKTKRDLFCQTTVSHDFWTKQNNVWQCGADRQCGSDQYWSHGKYPQEWYPDKHVEMSVKQTPWCAEEEEFPWFTVGLIHASWRGREEEEHRHGLVLNATRSGASFNWQTVYICEKKKKNALERATHLCISS